jgi:hypothetical protein
MRIGCRGNVFTEPLSSNGRRIHVQKHRPMGGICEMGSGVMIYIRSYINIGSDVQKLIGRNTKTHRQRGDLINLLLFFQNKESRLKIRRGIK